MILECLVTYGRWRGLHFSWIPSLRPSECYVQTVFRAWPSLVTMSQAMVQHDDGQSYRSQHCRQGKQCLRMKLDSHQCPRSASLEVVPASAEDFSRRENTLKPNGPSTCRWFLPRRPGCTSSQEPASGDSNLMMRATQNRGSSHAMLDDSCRPDRPAALLSMQWAVLATLSTR